MTEVIMLSILICCSISDLKDYKVKNCVIVFGWLYALFAGYMNLGIAGIKSAVLCITITILVGKQKEKNVCFHILNAYNYIKF